MSKRSNDNPMGERNAHEVLQEAIDHGMVQNVMERIEAAGEDMLVVVCNLRDELGLAVAKFNADFKEQDQGDNDLWVYALDKEHYKQLMYEHDAKVEGDRMRPLEKQIVVYTAGISHYFSAKGRYSGKNKGQHWAQFRKRDLH